MKQIPGVLLMLLIIMCAVASPALAGDLIISRSVLEDTAGNLTIDDVAGREFKPIGPTLSRGITKSVYWLRLRVKSPVKGGEAVLFIRQPFLNEIHLYEADAAAPQNWKTRVTGNYYPYSARDRASTSLGFVVNVAAPESTYYLRLKTRSPMLFSVEALLPEEAERKDHQFDLMEVLFATSMILLLLWAIHGYLLERMPVAGMFAVHQAVYTLYGVAITGYLAPLVPAGFPWLADLVTGIPYCAVSFTTLLFCRELFKPYNPPPLMMRGLNLFMLLFPLQLLLMALGYNEVAIVSNALLIKVSWWYFVVMTFMLRSENSPSRRLLQVFFLLITLVFTLFWISKFNFLESANLYFGRQVLITNGLIIGCLFAMLLDARLRRVIQEGQRSEMELLMTQKTLEIERSLKESAEIQAHTDYLTGIYNRRYFIELAEHEMARSLRYQRPLSLLMIDIDHFKSVNDTWGHRTGDIVLQKVTLLIQNEIREMDIVSRLGGEEFAVLLVETDLEQAMQVAQRLCSAVEGTRIISSDGETLQVTISLGLAGLKNRDINIDQFMHEADMALYNAKQSGRNRVVFSE